MRETLAIVKSMYDTYNGTGMQMALFFACLIYLCVRKPEREKRHLFVGYALLFFLICFFPVTARLIMAGIGQEVYWRMFWLLPVTAVTAYTGVQILMQMEGKGKRLMMLGALFLVIVLTGSPAYNRTVFQRKENAYKLSQAVVDVCDMVEQDAAANGVSHKKLITVNDWVNEIRQYDAEILMPYGGEALKGLRTETENAAQIFRIMSSEAKNWEALAWYAAMEGCNYLAYPSDVAALEALTACGYEAVGANELYTVYRREADDEDYEGQWLITQYGAAEGSQLMFYTMQDREGHLVVVDGGYEEDAPYVRKTIRALGGHVDAWILTHPHKDHAGAFTKIYKKPGKISVGKVYAVDMASPEKCMESSPWDEVDVYRKWKKLSIEGLQYVHAGDAFEVEGLSFQVFNAYDEYVDGLSKDLLNDGSMMFKVTANEESMLFCADVGERMSEYLLDTYGDGLKADYIQMGHHGNGGLSKEFYRFIEAKAAFFDAPGWLMQDEGGRYSTPENARLMKKSGAAVYSYATTPNQLILK